MANILPFTYFNAKTIAKALEEIGYKPIQVLDIFNLAKPGDPGDRQTFHIEGNKFIYPGRPAQNDWGDYNNGTYIQVSFNSDGANNDDWVDFTPVVNPIRPFLYQLEEFVFYKFTIRNAGPNAWGSELKCRIYIIQDPTYIIQLNKLIKDLAL